MFLSKDSASKCKSRARRKGARGTERRGQTLHFALASLRTPPERHIARHPQRVSRDLLSSSAMRCRSARRTLRKLRAEVAACGKSATPPAAACARRIAHERGAPVRPAPAAERCALARPAVDQPGGDPAPPIGSRRASTAANGGSARRLGAGLGSRSCVALGGAARPLAPRNRGLAPRDRGDEPPADAGTAALHSFVVPLRWNASTEAAGSAPPPSRFRAAVADHSGEARSWNTRAQTNSVRCAHCASLTLLTAYASRSAFRS